MKIKVSEMTGPTLDWAVEKARGMDISGDVLWLFDGSKEGFAASTDWAQGGPIIEQEKISVCENAGRWVAGTSTKGQEQYGPTPLIAAMRCYVASRLGDTVEIPEEISK